jgi:hypothetical protein
MSRSDRGAGAATGREAESEAYERNVSRIMARYGGVIERAIRTSKALDDGSDEPFEVHVLKFPSRDLYDAYRADGRHRRDTQAKRSSSTVLAMG